MKLKLFILIFVAFAYAGEGGVPPVNAKNPGQTIDLKPLIESGKITIVDFYSEYCGPCRILAPKLKQLRDKNQKINVVPVDINRSGKKGIDWKSPVIDQYKIQSLPHLKVYNEKGELIAEAGKARQLVAKYMQESKIGSGH